MAKISARGATEVARIKSEISGLGGYTHILRSDRGVLRKTPYATGYLLVGKVPKHIAEAERVPFFERYVARFVAARS